jgi:hypothetical protein
MVIVEPAQIECIKHDSKSNQNSVVQQRLQQCYCAIPKWNFNTTLLKQQIRFFNIMSEVQNKIQPQSSHKKKKKTQSIDHNHPELPTPVNFKPIPIYVIFLIINHN